MMQNSPAAELAHHVLLVHGARACGEARHQAELCEREGETETARLWREVATLVGSIRSHC
jgi:hypothetical protein